MRHGCTLPHLAHCTVESIWLHLEHKRPEEAQASSFTPAAGGLQRTVCFIYPNMLALLSATHEKSHPLTSCNHGTLRCMLSSGLLNIAAGGGKSLLAQASEDICCLDGCYSCLIALVARLAACPVQGLRA